VCMSTRSGVATPLQVCHNEPVARRDEQRRAIMRWSSRTRHAAAVDDGHERRAEWCLLTGPELVVVHGSATPQSERGQQLAERQRVGCPTPGSRRMCDRHGRGSVQPGAGVSSTQPSRHPGHRVRQRSGMRFSGGGIDPAYRWDWDCNCRRDSLPPPPFTRQAAQASKATKWAPGTGPPPAGPPLSSELWHCTAYPFREATLGHPLGRGNLS
jgi:hypothetical protein